MSFWEIIGTSWRDAIWAIRRNLPVFLSVFLALFLLALAFDYFGPHSHRMGVTAPHVHSVPRSTPLTAIFDIIQDVITAIIVTPLMVSVHRFVLVGEFNETLNNKKRLRFFALYLIFIDLVSALPGAIEGFVQPQSVSQVLLLCIICSAWIITVRLLLAYPAAALDKPSPLDDSWAKTRGRWWYIVSVMTCGVLPFLIVIPIMAFINYSAFKTTVPAFGGIFILELFFAKLISVFSIALAAAIVSKLYLKFSALSDIRPAAFVKGRKQLGWGGKIWIGIFAMSGAAYQLFPKSAVNHVLNLALIVCVVPLLIAVLFLVYINMKKRFRWRA